jgi:hyperosmotically inducible protein
MYSSSLKKAPILMCAIVALSACAWANDPADGSSEAIPQHRAQPVTDAWIDTRLETAYLFNRHLNNFNIQTDVDRGVVLLTGTVRTDIDKDLAEEIARSLNGVKSINNHLVVKPSLKTSPRNEGASSFAQKVDDATTTARVRARLVANENLAGLAINVGTRNSVVTLAVNVSSHEQKQLAELIARNTPEVQGVANDLRVQTPPSETS